ncbi:hypothetical protein X777_09147 [Ooceraea biroi]|uniref:Retrotransposon gag domain-containing protein n=1 Tax=Ooceraea biroi TaxID=2015173 RepID=A0A026X350_OOCBI|nr:hypothetical protein X777_09147 [Ooceraea biroi]
MSQNNFVTLKYAVEAVPFFDGSNIPLNYFVEGCEEAKSMLPSEAESQFTKIVRTRRAGEARRTIQDQEFDTIAKLTKYLKQIYGSSKNAYQLQGELGNIYQKNEEDVVTYANRVKVLGKQILEAYRSTSNLAANCRKITQNKPDLGNEILICQICNMRGHSADKCRFREPQLRAAVHVTQIVC